MKRLRALVERMLGMTERHTDDEARVILAQATEEQDARLSAMTGIPQPQLSAAARRAALRYSAARASQRLAARAGR